MSSILETHPEIAKQWHPTKNGDLKIENVTKGSHEIGWWLCSEKSDCGCSHEWSTKIYNRFRKKPSGCPFCSKNGKHHCFHQTIRHTHPEIASEWHPDKNGELIPEDIATGSNQKVWWLCSKKFECECPHEYESIVANRTYHGNGCPYCSFRKTCIHRSLVHTYPEIAAQWHPTRNGELKPEMFSHGSDEKIWWKCLIGCQYGCTHEWEAVIGSRCFRDHGCPYCASTHKKVCIHNSIVTTEPEVAAEWDYEKNDDLDPKTIPRSSEIKAYFLCQNGHSYLAIIGNRCRGGSGCPTCKNKTQKFVFEFLKISYPDLISEFPAPLCKKRRVDFCIPSLKIIIELDGLQHFEKVGNWMSPEEAIKLDVLKMKGALDSGYSIIRISQTDVYLSSFRRDGKWTSDSLLTAIKDTSQNKIQYISQDPEMYSQHKLAMLV